MKLEALGNWIKQNRREKEMSQAELGERVGCRGTYISEIERAHPHSTTGKPTRPNVELLDKMAELFGENPNIPRRLAGYSDKETNDHAPDNAEREAGLIVQSVEPEKRPALIEAFRAMAKAVKTPA